MTPRDPVLEEMVLALSAMPARDRSFVLAQLGDEAGQMLTPLLEDMSRGSLSPALESLSEANSGGQPSTSITEKAAVSLRRAVQAISERAPIRVEEAPARGDWIDRAVRTVAGRR